MSEGGSILLSAISMPPTKLFLQLLTKCTFSKSQSPLTVHVRICEAPSITTEAAAKPQDMNQRLVELLG